MRKPRITSVLLILCFLTTLILGLDCREGKLSPTAPSGELSQPETLNPKLTTEKRKVHGYVTNWGIPNEAAWVKLFVDYPSPLSDYTYYTFSNSSGYYKFDGYFEHSDPHTEYVTVIALGAQFAGEGGSFGTRRPKEICPPKTYSSISPGWPGSKFYYDPNYNGWIWLQNFSFQCGGPPS